MGHRFVAARRVKRILVVGAPRSGTTWLASTLAATPGSRLVHEPDNPAFNAAAEESHMVYGGYPVLHRRQRVPAYQRLWDVAFRDDPQSDVKLAASAFRFEGRRNAATPSSVIAKSVFAAFALDWLVERYAPRIVLIERHPADVVSSWMRLDFQVGDLATREDVRSAYVERLGLPPWDATAPRLLQVAWAVGVLMSSMRHQSRTRPEWLVVSHRTLSRDPAAPRALAASVGLSWSEEAEAAAQRPTEVRRYSQEKDRRELTDFLLQFPELVSWLDGDGDDESGTMPSFEESLKA